MVKGKRGNSLISDLDGEHVLILWDGAWGPSGRNKIGSIALRIKAHSEILEVVICVNGSVRRLEQNDIPMWPTNLA